LIVEQEFKSDLAFAYLEYSKFLLNDHTNAYQNLGFTIPQTLRVIDEDKLKKVNVRESTLN
jgi:hypothetical protein